jgi:hypothetical protein
MRGGFPNDFQDDVQDDAGGSVLDIARGFRWWYPAWLGAACIPLVVGVVFLAVSPFLRAQAAHSGFVQAHGVRRAAVVLSVNNIADTSTNTTGTGSRKRTTTSTSYTAEVAVRLASPVNGQALSTVHVPRYDSDAPGTTLTVLVDPGNPGYSELPGAPSASGILPTVFLIVGSALVVIGLTAAAFVARSWRRSVRHAA